MYFEIFFSKGIVYRCVTMNYLDDSETEEDEQFEIEAELRQEDY